MHRFRPTARDRATLHRSKLDAFKRWLPTQGAEVLKTKGDFEVLRWRWKKRLGDAMPIIFDGKSPEHFTANAAAEPWVRKFVHEQNERRHERGER